MGALEKRLPAAYKGTVSVIPNPVSRWVGRGMALAGQPKNPLLFASTLQEAQKNAGRLLAKE
ncbi:MAG TPA: hypothetical protein DCE41_25315 [Cytophagales bacterium]|nr:hypothetical protein [Cytophagales bacterium]HAP59865.1 hypothetical protein [Cytophagales bacterium]